MAEATDRKPRKLYQVLANVNSVKSRESDEITRLHKISQVRGLYDGQVRSYQPVSDDETERLPDEATRVQQNGTALLAEARASFARLLDAEAMRDYTNLSVQARADIVIEGTTVLRQVPAIYCLALEKQLTDLRTLVAKLPTLDPAFDWEFDPNTDGYRTKQVQTVRTKKVLRNHVKAEATEKHPAQVEVFTEDVKVGTWNTIKQSAAFPASRVRELVERIDRAIQAVRVAREEANGADVVETSIGAPLMGWIFGGK